MINRPELNRERQEVEDISEALQWLFHGAQNLGV